MNNIMDLSVSDQLDRLSAFLDGELSESEFEAVLDCLDGDCCAELKSYQIIGDVMRDSSLAVSTSDLFSVRLSKALDAEPTHSLESQEEIDVLQATGTDGAVSNTSIRGQTAQVHDISSKSRTRFAFVAGGVAAAFATIVTYNVLQSDDLQSVTGSSAPVLVSSEVHQVAPVVAVAESAQSQSQSQSFSRAPTMLASGTSSASPRASTEERRRTYPEYLRSHSDMSAHTPFMQVNYQGLGVEQ